MTSLADVMKTAEYEMLTKERADSLHSRVKWDLVQIRNSLLPIIVSMGEEPELAGLLSEIDTSSRRWTSHFPLTDYDAGYHYIDAVSLMDATARAYGYLVDNWIQKKRSL